MTDQLRITQQSDDDDDEDLERLRLEALKTIHSKKENLIKQQPTLQLSTSSSLQSYYQSTKLHLKPAGGPIIANPPYNTASIHPHVIRPINTYQQSTSYLNDTTNQAVYYPPLPQSDGKSLLDAQNHNNLNSYEARQRLKNLDINEPYVPQRVPPIATVNPNIPPAIIPTKTPENWIGTEPTSMATNSYNPYVPHKIPNNVMNVTGVGNVQLSPRSMAFVAKNNDILMRRKGESNYHRSPYSPRSPSSPVSPRCSSPPYRSSPGRWSRSPSPKPHSPKSRNRQLYQAKPSDFRRNLSKSPPYYRYQSKSPPPSNFRSGRKSRSPQMYMKNNKLSPHRLSRSPNMANARHNGRLNSRSPPSNGRRKSFSPAPPPRYHQNRSQANSPMHSRRSPIPRKYDSGESSKTFNRRSRSPPVNQLMNNNMNRKSLSPRQRSRSRSPIKKFQKRPRENFTQNARRNTPLYDRNQRRRNDNNVKGGFRNRNRKRSASPVTNFRKKRSRTKSPDSRFRRDDNRPRKFERNDRRRFIDNNNTTRNDRRDDRSLTPENRYPRTNTTNTTRKEGRIIGDNDRQRNKRNFRENRNENKDEKFPAENEIKKENIENIISNEDKANERKISSPVKDEENFEKKENDLNTDKNKEIDDEDEIKTPSRHSNDDNENAIIEKEEKENLSENNDSSESDDDDGIDLFASEESESENEGRFKLSSSKNERDTQVSTLSFSKLCESSVPVKDLKELDTKRESTLNTTDNRNRNRERGDRSNYNDRRRDDKFKKINSLSDRRRNNINRENNSRSNSRDQRGKYDYNNDDDQKIEENKKPMFKSTFTAVESDAIKGSNTKFSLNKETRKDSSQSKKKFHDKFEKDSAETGSKSPSQGLTSSTANGNGSGKLLSSVATVAGGKKPIHLRLGAMTNTFKAAKKSSNRSSSEKV